VRGITPLIREANHSAGFFGLQNTQCSAALTGFEGTAYASYGITRGDACCLAGVALLEFCDRPKRVFAAPHRAMDPGSEIGPNMRRAQVAHSECG
jgi:hypothetical protein